jgi:Uma2 family endonuclease
VIVAMAGGSDEHNAIAGRFAGLFAVRVPAGCLYYTPDQRFWIAATARGRYSDGSSICGKPEHPTHDEQATNPSVVLEVLSRSSEGDDAAGDKRRDFFAAMARQPIRYRGAPRLEQRCEDLSDVRPQDRAARALDDRA